MKSADPKVGPSKLSFPLKGQQLYIGDRQRDAQLRNEIFSQVNEHTKLLS